MMACCTTQVSFEAEVGGLGLLESVSTSHVSSNQFFAVSTIPFKKAATCASLYRSRGLIEIRQQADIAFPRRREHAERSNNVALEHVADDCALRFSDLLKLDEIRVQVSENLLDQSVKGVVAVEVRKTSPPRRAMGDSSREF